MMSVADKNAVSEEKKSAFCEDSTDSDNDTDRKPLLRRISTSKCVGRLVSPLYFVNLIVLSKRYSFEAWACQERNLSNDGGAGGLSPCARAVSNFGDQFFLTILFANVMSIFDLFM